ncbi:MAG: hypothetical protein DRJ35_01310 [Thermoprotei archaeon]|nr:MAG: hypothetical protein DRJ35_01310 [Thermoprotei archaeon]
MQKITLTIKAKRAEILYGCFKTAKPIGFNGLIKYAKNLVNNNQWIIILGKSSLIPTKKILTTIASYALYAYFEKKMISKWLEIEFLLYLFGTRNISEATRLAGAEKTDNIGLVVIGVEEEINILKNIVKKIEEEYALENVPCIGWEEEFSKILGIKERNPERIAGIMRSRAATLSLSV